MKQKKAGGPTGKNLKNDSSEAVTNAEERIPAENERDALGVAQILTNDIFHNSCEQARHRQVLRCMPNFTTKSCTFGAEKIVYLDHLTHDTSKKLLKGEPPEPVVPGLDDAQGRDLEKPRELTCYSEFFQKTMKERQLALERSQRPQSQHSAQIGNGMKRKKQLTRSFSKDQQLSTGRQHARRDSQSISKVSSGVSTPQKLNKVNMIEKNVLAKALNTKLNEALKIEAESRGCYELLLDQQREVSQEEEALNNSVLKLRQVINAKAALRMQEIAFENSCKKMRERLLREQLQKKKTIVQNNGDSAFEGITTDFQGKPIVQDNAEDVIHINAAHLPTPKYNFFNKPKIQSNDLLIQVLSRKLRILIATAFQQPISFKEDFRKNKPELLVGIKIPSKKTELTKEQAHELELEHLFNVFNPKKDSFKKLLEHDTRYDPSQNIQPFTTYNKSDDTVLVKPARGVDFYQDGKMMRGGIFQPGKNRVSPHKNKGLQNFGPNPEKQQQRKTKAYRNSLALGSGFFNDKAVHELSEDDISEIQDHRPKTQQKQTRNVIRWSQNLDTRALLNDLCNIDENEQRFDQSPYCMSTQSLSENQQIQTREVNAGSLMQVKHQKQISSQSKYMSSTQHESNIPNNRRMFSKSYQRLQTGGLTQPFVFEDMGSTYGERISSPMNTRNSTALFFQHRHAARSQCLTPHQGVRSHTTQGVGRLQNNHVQSQISPQSANVNKRQLGLNRKNPVMPKTKQQSGNNISSYLKSQINLDQEPKQLYRDCISSDLKSRVY